MFGPVPLSENTDDLDDGGICIQMFQLRGSVAVHEYSTDRGIILFNLVILLPIVVFFMFDQPHDCFVCFGKDPDHTYSSY